MGIKPLLLHPDKQQDIKERPILRFLITPNQFHVLPLGIQNILDLISGKETSDGLLLLQKQEVLQGRTSLVL